MNPAAELSEVIAALRELGAMQGISFVYGKGKRKTELQRDCDKLCEYLKKEEEDIEKLNI